MKTKLSAITIVSLFSLNLIGQMTININGTNKTIGKKEKTETNTNTDQGTNTNNSNSVETTGGKLPDIYLDPENSTITIAPGNTSFNVKVNVRIINSEGVAVQPGLSVDYYLIKGNTITDSDLLLGTYNLPDGICGNCYTGTWWEFNLSHESFRLFESGQYYIGVKIDDGNKISETNEENNNLVINTLVDYSVPAGVTEYNQYAAKKTENENYMKENAGKIFFGIGKFDYSNANQNSYVTEVSISDLVNAVGSDEFGEELSFFVIFKRSLKEQFALYRNQGLDSKSWPDDANWVNLNYKLIIDNKDTIFSNFESEAIRPSTNFFSRWLTGKYATGSKLQLQHYLLAELYKLAPGSHKLKLQVYVKSIEYGHDAIGPEVISEGELTVNVTSTDKINHFKKYNTLKPAAKMTNTTLAAQMKQFIVDYYSETDAPFSLTDIKYFSILDSEWEYQRNDFGVIISRSIGINTLVKNKNGSCGSYWMTIGENNIGEGSYSKPSFATYDDVSCVPCEALN